MAETRYAVIASAETAVIARYLPPNYRVVGTVEETGETVITGQDMAGWTLEDYVLKRLASGMLFGRELS